jgi:hypothetical protein
MTSGFQSQLDDPDLSQENLRQLIPLRESEP